MTERESSYGQAHKGRIRDAAFDYMQSWLDGDLDRMRRCLHPDLAKRRVLDAASGDPALWEVPAADLIDDVASGQTLHAEPSDQGRRLAAAGGLLRTLDDGTPHVAIKLFHEPLALADALTELGWDAEVHSAGHRFRWGTASRR